MPPEVAHGFPCIGARCLSFPIAMIIVVIDMLLFKKMLTEGFTAQNTEKEFLLLEGSQCKPRGRKQWQTTPRNVAALA